ncbi:MAG: UDP-N-acetylmuramoyl-tripeptide--D-alanyl-D-alanine ligase [Saprospiraceae bacterium]|nr:UDP-N-acetylmuramoyl-tripeptide--D-alanyl-D-alanine ligase [Saprospiraceae bacterium]
MNIEGIYKIFKTHPIVTIDSRKITEGCLFFALKGENFDGNAFAEKAIETGAAYAFIDNPHFQKSDYMILVDDVLTTLQQLATHHRRQFDIPVIAIAGSNGKTTTKELVAAVMNSHYPTHFTKGNFNNHIGVPLTLLQLTEEHEAAIIEIGANHQGETHDLCVISEPTHGVVTNMGKDHLEGFGGIEGVKKGNSEIYRWLAKHRGTVFVNEDEAFLQDWLPKEGLHKICYHKTDSLSMDTPQYQVRLDKAAPLLEVSFLNEKGEVVHTKTQIVGDYNFANINTAIAIGKYFKVPATKISKAISDYLPSMNRSQLTKYGEATVILDAYNANPSSMALALKNLAQMPQAKKVAIMGDMFELGDESEAEHQGIYELAKSLNLNILVVIGKTFSQIALPTEGVVFETNVQAKEWFEQQNFDADTCILIKGSRGMKLEILLER